MQKLKYEAYRKLDPKTKRKRIDEAEQQEKNRKPNPQGSHKFMQIGFMNFTIHRGNQIIKLQTYRQKSYSTTKVVVCMFHGLNSHIGHGSHIAHQFAKHNITTVGFDYRGFGQSDGDQGYVDSLDQHLSDCKLFVKKIKQMYANKPIFALGLSMGGMTSYHLSLQDKKMFDGVILMAPALKNSVNGFLVGLTGLISKILPKKTPLAKPIYGKATSNPQITDDVKNDPHAFSGRVRLSTITMLVKVMNQSPQTFKDYQAPFVIFQGGLDKMVNPQVAFELYDNAKSEDKQIYFYEDMWHDIWHQPQIQQIIDICIKWIIQRAKLKGVNFESEKQEKQQSEALSKINISVYEKQPQQKRQYQEQQKQQQMKQQDYY